MRLFLTLRVLCGNKAANHTCDSTSLESRTVAVRSGCRRKVKVVVQKLLPHKLILRSAVAIALVASVLIPVWVYSDQPRIEFIETYSTNQVRIHYGTPPNHSYVLQRINVLSSNGVVFTNWSDMHTGFAFPFTNHYIIPDSRSNRTRFYRLKVIS